MADRFGKFTERARRVLSLAQDEAQRFNHNYIGTEHLLLGIVREGDGVASKVLANLGVELNKVRSAVEFIIGRGDRPYIGEIGLTPRAKKVIELGVDEARRLNYQYIGTEHLLLGLIREGEGIAAGVLESLGVILDRVRAETTRILSQSMPQGQRASADQPSPGTGEWTLRLLWDALASIQLLKNQATEQDDHERASQLNDQEAALWTQINRLEMAKSRSSEPLGQRRAIFGSEGLLLLTPEARHIFNVALGLARELDQSQVSTAHLLLAILHEQDTAAVGLLAGMGVDLLRMRVAVRALAGKPPDNVADADESTPLPE